ncbi:hypothetical protein HYDPIDRAFT_113625, partial [Hydnomerulius pinastri MD-312]
MHSCEANTRISKLSSSPHLPIPVIAVNPPDSLSNPIENKSSPDPNPPSENDVPVGEV